MSAMMSYFSLTTTPIEILGLGGVSCGHATGFFYKADNSDIYLITNWHVVTGREPSNPNFSKSGAIPLTLRCRLHSKIDGVKAIRLSQNENFDIKINTKDGNNPEWLEHPIYRHKVDVVAIRLDSKNLNKSFAFNVLNDYQQFEKRYITEAMDDVFIIGYPWGLKGGNAVLPIFKRGSVASEPIIDYEGLPRFLVDCRTSSGMSGSPVLVSHSGIWQPDVKMSAESLLGTISNFIGIYSGRLISVNDKEVSEIGIVWKKEAIEDVVNKGFTGTKISDLQI